MFTICVSFVDMNSSLNINCTMNMTIKDLKTAVINQLQMPFLNHYFDSIRPIHNHKILLDNIHLSDIQFVDNIISFFMPYDVRFFQKYGYLPSGSNNKSQFGVGSYNGNNIQTINNNGYSHQNAYNNQYMNSNQNPNINSSRNDTINWLVSLVKDYADGRIKVNPWKILSEKHNFYEFPEFQKDFEIASQLNDQQTMFICYCISHNNLKLNDLLQILAAANYDPNQAWQIVASYINL